jgi:molecular chaperone Hsp33
VSDALARALLEPAEVRVCVVVATAAAREARSLHGLLPGAAAVLAQGLAGAALVASLQKQDARINLQVECDGALRGLFVDASSEGALRGYVKNPLLDLEGHAGAFRWRPALGNKGFLSVLRSQDNGEFYRSAVELTAFDLALDLNHYFATSDQVSTRVALHVAAADGERLGAVVGVLVQAMPQAAAGAVDAVAADLQARLEAAVDGKSPVEASALARALFGAAGLEAQSEVPVRYSCSCSKDRVLDAIAALGPDQVQDMLEKQGGTEVKCHFCGRTHKVVADELRALLARASA